MKHNDIGNIFIYVLVREGNFGCHNKQSKNVQCLNTIKIYFLKI